MIPSDIVRVMPSLAPNCPCPKRDCPRHGNCQECVTYHKAKGEMPFCARES